MSRDVYTLVVRTHGCKHAGLPQSYFVAVMLVCDGAPLLHLPAVMDDFGDLVIVGRPL